MRAIVVRTLAAVVAVTGLAIVYLGDFEPSRCGGGSSDLGKSHAGDAARCDILSISPEHLMSDDLAVCSGRRERHGGVID